MFKIIQMALMYLVVTDLEHVYDVYDRWQMKSAKHTVQESDLS